ncbi:hypothetical protein D3C78_1361330 [compost metagenome]
MARSIWPLMIFSSSSDDDSSVKWKYSPSCRARKRAMARPIFLFATGSICPSRPMLMLPETLRLMCCTSTRKPSAAASKRRAASMN